jgi:hypothetical protein
MAMMGPGYFRTRKGPATSRTIMRIIGVSMWMLKFTRRSRYSYILPR